MRHRGLFWVVICLLLNAHADATPIRICISDIAAAPLAYPDGSGEAVQLLNRAAAATGHQFNISVLPWRRCRAAVAVGQQDAALMAFSPETAQQAMFPMRDGQPDRELRLGNLRRVVVRSANTQADWDGQAFSRLSQPVLLGQGQAYTRSRLQALGVRANDSPKSPRQILQMLLAGHAELAILSEYDAKELLTHPLYAGRIETLPKPFADIDVYLGVNTAFYKADPAMVTGLWKTLGQLRGRGRL